MTFGEVVMVLREVAEALGDDLPAGEPRVHGHPVHRLADYLLAAHHFDGVNCTVQQLRAQTGVCPNGKGHWRGHCSAACTLPELPVGPLRLLPPA